VNVAVMGTGHVGLVTSVTLAGLGNNVIGTDIDEEKIDLLQKGTSPFYEPGLEEALVGEIESKLCPSPSCLRGPCAMRRSCSSAS